MHKKIRAKEAKLCDKILDNIKLCYHLFWINDKKTVLRENRYILGNYSENEAIVRGMNCTELTQLTVAILSEFSEITGFGGRRYCST